MQEKQKLARHIEAIAKGCAEFFYARVEIFADIKTVALVKNNEFLFNTQCLVTTKTAKCHLSLSACYKLCESGSGEYVGFEPALRHIGRPPEGDRAVVEEIRKNSVSMTDVIKVLYGSALSDKLFFAPDIEERAKMFVWG